MTMPRHPPPENPALAMISAGYDGKSRSAPVEREDRLKARNVTEGERCGD